MATWHKVCVQELPMAQFTTQVGQGQTLSALLPLNLAANPVNLGANPVISTFQLYQDSGRQSYNQHSPSASPHMSSAC
jgi:hypothetical protein